MSPRAFGHEPINFKHMTPAIKALIVANIAAFLLGQIAGAPFLELFGLVPRRLIEDRWVWQVVTYLFVHGNLFHLLFNLFALWMFGMAVESQWGEKEFLKYYFLCGLGAAAASVLLSPRSGVPVIGASGCIYGLLVAFAMLYPDSVIYLYFLIPLKASHFAILFGLIEFFAVASGDGDGIARLAHLGGMVTGYVYIRWWWVVKLKAKGFLRGRGPEEEAPAPRPPRRKGRSEAEPSGEEVMAAIDRILDKILVSGIDSLTEEERDIMRRYSERSKK